MRQIKAERILDVEYPFLIYKYMNWTFTVEGEYLKLSSAISNQTYYFLKRYTFFIPNYSEDKIKIMSSGSNMYHIINRNECAVPIPGVNIDTFMTSLITLASA